MKVAIVRTGFANLASVSAWFARAGVESYVTQDPEAVRREAFVVLPGVGSFGPAAEVLRAKGLDRVLRERADSGAPTAGFCLGMQLFFEASEEDPGVPGLGILPGTFTIQPAGMRSPRLGWGTVEVVAANSGGAASGDSRGGAAGGDSRGGAEGNSRGGVAANRGGLVQGGWAAFANSYRLETPPPGMLWSRADYGGSFVASCERPGLLLCQFHPELSGKWGAALLERWLASSGMAAKAAGGRSEGRAGGGGVAAGATTTVAANDAAIAAGGGSGAARIAAASATSGAATQSSGTAKGGSGFAPLPGAGAVRIIPCLDVDAGRVVKGTQFKELRDAGDPAELSARYEAEGADEIVILDITAGIEGRATRLDTVRRVRERVGIPLAIGGGIGSIEDAARLFDAGADRVSVNTRAVREPALIGTIAERYGRQAVVVAIDATRKGDSWEVVVDAGRTATGLDAVEWARRAADLGAGEILLTSRDRDGSGLGYDLELVRAVAKAVPISVIASGGAATPEQMAEGARAGAGAVLAAGAFHFGRYSIREVKDWFLAQGLEARL
ncbi:MAG: imidazole glycerol phosphate synthase subunit HisF [Treponema sp.]|nr:imidazole glycerol phosphate synthase subunit HisF [Treponema sp.]